MAKKKVIIIPGENKQKWLCTFNDLMTILLAFFVLILSMSSPNALRDAILLILSARSFDDIKTNQDKLVLKEELLMQLNSYLNTGLTKNIYFTSFVVR